MVLLWAEGHQQEPTVMHRQYRQVWRLQNLLVHSYSKLIKMNTGKPAENSKHFQAQVIRIYNYINNNQGFQHKWHEQNYQFLSVSCCQLLSTLCSHGQNKKQQAAWSVCYLPALSQAPTERALFLRRATTFSRCTTPRNDKNLRDRLTKKYPFFGWPYMKILWK